MTDKERMKALLDDFGVEYRDEGRRIILEEGGRKVVGYLFFYTVFEFDEEGKFEDVGAYE